MKALNQFREKIFPTPRFVPPGMYPYQTPSDAPVQYRLHLRIEPDGRGLLILNAHTVLHLNQTATEYAWHLVKGTPLEKIASLVSRRYKVSKEVAQADYLDLEERLKTFINTPDLDPDIFLDFDRIDPYSADLAAPYRLDCALTYQSNKSQPHIAPEERVRRELVTEEWKIILENAWRSGIPHVVFTGGEPTIRPDLVELISLTQQIGLVSGLVSDGLRLTNPDYLHALLLAGLDHLMLVLDDSDNQSWEAVKDVSAEDLYMTVHITLNRHNRSKIGKILDQLLANDVKAVSLSVMEMNQTDSLKEAQTLVAEKHLDLHFDLPVPYSNFRPSALDLEDKETIYSGAGHAWLYVEPDGDVLPAQGVNQVLGNILTDPWEKIWRGGKQ